VTTLTRTERPAASRLRRSTTPARVRALTAAALILAAILGVVITTEVSSVDGGLTQIGGRSGPQVVATADLYFAFNDMDAQLANILLAGGDPALAKTRSDALRIYEQRRLQAGQDIQQAAAAAGNNAAAQRALKSVLDGLGTYEALAAQTMLLDGEKTHPAGRPPKTALQYYRQATDQLKAQVLPAVKTLTDANAAALQRTYQDRRSGTRLAAFWIGLVGLGLVGALLALQVFLTRRFRRRINPALALATVGALGLVVSGSALFMGESEHMRVAKKDAFDSILALSQARAVSFDANADESRFLVDPARAAKYQEAYLTKSQQLLELPGVTIGSYDGSLANAVGAYRVNNSAVRFHGFYGTGFRNITFAGERAAAERTLTAFQAYERDDRKIRALANVGDLRGSIAFATGYTAGQSNADFGRYDDALTGWIKINQNAFDDAVKAGHDDLTGWTVIPAVTVLAVMGLIITGIRPRLAEYR
jgi:hypothetical protein